MTEDEAIKVYDDDSKRLICEEYLHAAVLTGRHIKKKFPDPDGKVHYDSDAPLTALLQAEVIFLNTHWWMESWPEEARKTTALNVGCNDVFAWGCADAEEITIHEVNDLFDHYTKDPEWGAAIWCMKKRKMMPQPPVERLIRVAGIWNLDEMGLEPSPFAKDWSAESLKRYGELKDTANG